MARECVVNSSAQRGQAGTRDTGETPGKPAAYAQWRSRDSAAKTLGAFHTAGNGSLDLCLKPQFQNPGKELFFPIPPYALIPHNTTAPQGNTQSWGLPVPGSQGCRSSTAGGEVSITQGQFTRGRERAESFRPASVTVLLLTAQ